MSAATAKRHGRYSKPLYCWDDVWLPAVPGTRQTRDHVHRVTVLERSSASSRGPLEMGDLVLARLGADATPPATCAVTDIYASHRTCRFLLTDLSPGSPTAPRDVGVNKISEILGHSPEQAGQRERALRIVRSRGEEMHASVTELWVAMGPNERGDWRRKVTGQIVWNEREALKYPNESARGKMISRVLENIGLNFSQELDDDDGCEEADEDSRDDGDDTADEMTPRAPVVVAQASQYHLPPPPLPVLQKEEVGEPVFRQEDVWLPSVASIIRGSEDLYATVFLKDVGAVRMGTAVLLTKENMLAVVTEISRSGGLSVWNTQLGVRKVSFSEVRPLGLCKEFSQELYKACCAWLTGTGQTYRLATMDWDQMSEERRNANRAAAVAEYISSGGRASIGTGTPASQPTTSRTQQLVEPVSSLGPLSSAPGSTPSHKRRVDVDGVVSQHEKRIKDTQESIVRLRSLVSSKFPAPGQVKM